MQDTMHLTQATNIDTGLDTTATRTDTPAAPTADQFAAKKENDGSAFAIASFVVGIASIVSGWTIVAPIVGLILGVLALRRDTKERTLALWGVWMNAAILSLVAIMLVFGIGLLVFGLVAGTIV
ncbi:DUF4190 domain-containing protein [Leucobacter sp. cx-42]|uniref:DUF4190 domain-containing protein n=1 Tax=unclassified Leucobacter TaxID=2621730 RepID=UPI00165DFA91|nr:MULTISPECIES: DUF4190 domain-containing protein [unclassified Leucobacter]MBC9954485.1 DUF4190 domain-containing protein [Leucobacter sp. cx-42]